MAKGARASTTKSNNARLKSKVFGPVEEARNQRLSAKLLELAAQPRPSQKESASIDMNTKEVVTVSTSEPAKDEKKADSMDVDATGETSQKSKKGKGRIEKKRSRSKAGIVFPKFKAGKKVGGSTRRNR